jgi:hypothetical protein
VSKKSGKPAGYEAGNKAAEKKAKPSPKADLNPYAGPPLDTIVTEVPSHPALTEFPYRLQIMRPSPSLSSADSIPLALA